MASRFLRALGRGGDEAAEAADDVAENADRTRDIFAEAFAEQLGKTGPTAASQPARAADAATGNLAKLGIGLGGGGAALGGAGAYRSLQSRKEAEVAAEEREDQREDLQSILDNENVSDSARSAALQRALDSGLFDPNLGGDPDNPDTILDNVWFRRAVALVVAYYAAKTISDRYGG